MEFTVNLDYKKGSTLTLVIETDSSEKATKIVKNLLDDNGGGSAEIFSMQTNFYDVIDA